MPTALLQSPNPEMSIVEGSAGYLFFETKFEMLFVLWFKIYFENDHRILNFAEEGDGDQAAW